MIETLFGTDHLASPAGFFAALLVGLAFGFALERAGFGSSRKLAGIFYFRDMTVLKVMFTAVVTAMIGLHLCLGLGIVRADQIYFLPSVFGAQIIGGLIFGVGFAMAAWCPGTAAVGVASGRLDALVFLGGAVLGSVVFNETYSVSGDLAAWGDSGTRFAWAALGMSAPGFALLFAAVAVAAFWGAEYVENRVVGGGRYFNTPFLRAFSLAILILAGALLVLPSPSTASTAGRATAAAGVIASRTAEVALLRGMESGDDHFEPDELADRLMAGDAGLALIDIRTPEEYSAFHIRGAANVAAPDLPSYLEARRGQGTVVLYSNGMTHPAETRDALARLGFTNIYILTDGLEGFMQQILKPVSLRTDPLTQAQAARVAAWRGFFRAQAAPSTPPAAVATAVSATQPIVGLPGLVEPEWLAANLGRLDLKVIDVRAQPAWNTSHIPGSLCLHPESFRGVVKGVPSSLLPSAMLAQHLSLMGIRPDDTVVIVPSDKPHDATLVSMGFARLGHRRVGILQGGYEKWTAEKRPVDAKLPDVKPSNYPRNTDVDRFTVEYPTVLKAVGDKSTVILDVRPADFFTGKKTDEARAGHIPGAVNRPFSQDVVTADGITQFRPLAELEAAYAKLIPGKDTPVIVHCRTGHQASQTFFVLKDLLDYRNVRWYDAGWTEWAARLDLPVEKNQTP